MIGTHGWTIAALLREMANVEGHATFWRVESKFMACKLHPPRKRPRCGSSLPSICLWDHGARLEKGSHGTNHQICTILSADGTMETKNKDGTVLFDKSSKTLGYGSTQLANLTKPWKNEVDRVARIYRRFDILWRITCIFIFGCESCGVSKTCTEQGMGNKYDEKIVSFHEKEDENENGKISKNQMEQGKLPFLSEVIAGSMWRSLGWVCVKSTNAVMDPLQHIFTCRNTCWWREMKVSNTVVDPNNHTTWKHEWMKVQSWMCMGRMRLRVGWGWT